MSFNQFVNIPEEAKRKLSFLGAPYFYLYKNSGGKTLRGILYEISKENMEKAYKRLNGEPGEIVSGDKVFVLPNCRIPMFKLTDYLKETGAVQTPDVEKATKIIGHERNKEILTFQSLSSTFLHEYIYCNYVSQFTDRGVEGDGMEFRNRIADYRDVFEGEYNCEDTLVSWAVWNSTQNFIRGYAQPTRFITPTGVWILYNHLLNKIPIVNEDSVYEKIGKPIVLDSESYQSIHDMLGSQDGESNKVGAEVLANCDINPSLYWIWKLSKQFCYTVTNLSSYKNIRLFIRMSNWQDLYGMDEEAIAEYMMNKGVLTKEHFSNLIITAARSYADTLDSSLFTMTLTPSERFKEYSDGQVFSFNKEPESTQVEVVEDEEDEDIDDD